MSKAIYDMALDNIVDILKNHNRLFLVSHKDPDGDAIGSLLALGLALMLSGKEVVLFNEGPVSNSLASLKGAEKIVNNVDRLKEFDAFIVLDCGSLERVGKISSHLSARKPLINIDHHKNNTRFGDLNLVKPDSSSVGEIVYRLIKSAGLPLNSDIAGNIFAAIQADTGSFRYDNTTETALTIAGEMVGLGASPWKISRKAVDKYTLKQLEILQSVLKTVELHHSGQIGMMTVTKQMISEEADDFDSDRLLDYVRFLSGVELGVLVRECGDGFYKFNMRSNDWVDVADLAIHFGGGGHPRAAAFIREGSLDKVKREFLGKAIELLDKK
jgi:bifunctional oligoribonuclease and PAP phosphatase NrnA